MLSKLLPVIFLVLGTGAGIAAAMFMAPAPDHDALAKEPKHEKTTHADSSNDEAVYVKLNNQFVVPVVQNERVASLVVMSLSLETKSAISETVYAREPKLRDAFLRVLFDHANMGGFQGAFTQSDTLDLLRTALREVAQKELGDEIIDVLILDISRQDT